jgi:hypothetical protein
MNTLHSRPFLVMTLLCMLVALPLGGCRRQTSPSSQPATTAAMHQSQDDLLSYAIDNLARLEEFTSMENIQQIGKQLMQQVEQRKSGQSGDTLLAAWPEPEMLRQIVDRLNQWAGARQPPAGWKPDALLADLPEPLAELPQLKDLERMRFSRFDGFWLQEASWMKAVAGWARGDELDDLQRARHLFDWTVRNVQLDEENPRRIPRFPWETLLFGRGTAAERAWVFILLLRQLDIDAAVIEQDGKAWCVGVLVEDGVYLFDPTLGLPIPAADGLSRTENGGLEIKPATLAQVVADKKLLAQLDVNESRPYWLKAVEPEKLVARLEGSPPYLAARTKLLESRLAGGRKMVLSYSPAEQAAKWKAAGVGAARLWTRPYETIARRSSLDPAEVQERLFLMLPFYALPTAPLYHGRVLHLKGKLVGDDGAMKYYQAARPSEAELSASSARAEEKMFYSRGKQDAGYWSGLISFERENYPAAIDYFSNRTLKAFPHGPWTTGAMYNLGRSYEASGQKERAVLQYGDNDASPGYHGDLLRAKWLGELPAGK